jgi:hypothetical protein
MDNLLNKNNSTRAKANKGVTILADWNPFSKLFCNVVEN